jgi:hypothetical protein
MGKSTRMAAALITAGLALATGAAAYGNGSTAASASGASHLTLHDVFGLQTLVLQTFTFEAKLQADGSVSGQYHYRDLEDGVPFDASGPITCLVVHGNHAWLGGTITASNDPSYVGQDSWFQVIDNGEGANDPSDVTTLLGASDVAGTAQAYCDASPNPHFPWPVQLGNIQVRSTEG